MDITTTILSAVASAIGSLAMFVLRRVTKRLDELELHILRAPSTKDMRLYVDDKTSGLLRDIEDKKDRIIVLEAKIDRMMELLLEMKANAEVKRK